jgi:hypothetical protein
MNDDLPIDLQQYPPWREALRQFFRDDHTYGSTVPHSWFWAAFGLNEPAADTLNAEAEKSKLLYLAQFKAFEDALLVEHRMALASVRSIGYSVVPVEEQAQWAEHESSEELRKAIKKAAKRLVYVDITQLSDQGRKEHSDAMARLARRQAFLTGHEDRKIRRQKMLENIQG